MIRILSIPGSGTRWLAKCVFERAQTYHFGVEGRDQTNDRTIGKWLDEGQPLIPLRDPVLTIISNLNLGRRVYVESFRKMYEWERDDRVIVLPIEMDRPTPRRIVEGLGGDPDAKRDSDHCSTDHTGLREAYWEYMETGDTDDPELVSIISDVQKDDAIQCIAHKHLRNYRWLNL